MIRSILYGIVAILLILVSLAACAPARDPQAPNNDTSRDYYYDPRTGVCWSQWGSYGESAFGVDCTPEVMALVNKQSLPTTTEIAR